MKMQLKTYFLMLVWLLTGCGPLLHGPLEIDPEFTKDYMNYLFDMQGLQPKLDLISIKFVDDISPDQADSVTLGRCGADDIYEGRIIINRSTWAKGGVGAHKVLLYHELSHCVYDVGHSSVEGSIQNANMLWDEFTWEGDLTNRIQELRRFIERNGED